MMEESNSSGVVVSEAGTSAEACPFHSMVWGALAQRDSMWLALAAVLAAYSYVWVHWWARQPRGPPTYWPFVGCLPQLLLNWHRFHEFMLDLFESGRDCVYMALPDQEGVYVAAPKLVEHVLKTNFANYPKGEVVIKHADELFGRGIFNTDHEAWRLQRKVASHEFSSHVLRELSTKVYKQYSLKLLHVVEHLAPSNRPIDFQELFTRMTLDSTAQLGFGVELGCLSESLPEVAFCKAFDRVNELSYHRYVDLFWEWKRTFKILEEKELEDSIKILDAFSYEVIRKRRMELSSLKESGGSEKTRANLLSRFMTLTKENNEPYSDQDLRDIILNFIVAGRDTTGITLSWFIYRLCLNPEIAEKVLEEIQALERAENFSLEELGEDTPDRFTRLAEFLTYQNLGKLQYLHAALTETLRLYPPVPLDGKTALADDVLPDGTRIKKGYLVSYCSYAMGRLERVWGPDAKEFKPERWLKGGVFQPESPYKFPAFHAGPRACLGRDSAYVQMKLTAALLVRFFKFQMVAGQNITYRVMFVLSMKSGVLVNVSPR